jgi:HAD superfamily hydrolase (TIGR01509 family)
LIRTIVFDFDGVIANTEPLHFRALADVLQQEGVTLSRDDYYGRYLGYDDVGAFGALAADRTIQWDRTHVSMLVVRKAERLEALEQSASMLFPGAAAAIRRMAATCPLAIASGARRSEIMRVLDREGLTAFFPVIVGAEDTSRSKPAPEPYLRAFQQVSFLTGVSLTPSECLAVEDSIWGLESARTAGLRTVAITHTYSADALKPAADAVIGHLDQLTMDLLLRFDQLKTRPNL